MLGMFVEPGYLVFDVGANRGVYAEVLISLGCRVVAVEPNPALLPLIRRRAPAATVVHAAVGAQDGETSLKVGDQPDEDLHSTLSDRYAADLEKTLGYTLTRKIMVPMVSLASLTAKYGEPEFVKIDVEGWEAEVLRGLAEPPRALSFEFHGSMLDELSKCLVLLPSYVFRISIGNDFRWSTEWMDASSTLAAARHFAEGHPELFADVYALRINQTRST
jgi:FkbM family methyltransferase